MGEANFYYFTCLKNEMLYLIKSEEAQTVDGRSRIFDLSSRPTVILSDSAPVKETT